MKKFAVVTGASGGIGAEICRRLAESGFDLIIHYMKNAEGAEALKNELEENFHITAHAVQADFSLESGVEAFARQVLSLGSPSVLVNNAGIAHQQLFQDVEAHKAQEIYFVNCGAAMLLTQRLLPSMISEKYGRIVNISSMWGVCGASCEVHYSASKAAMIGFTKALAKEVGPSGITVNCVAPGLIDTEMNAALDEAAKAAVVEETPEAEWERPQTLPAR